VVRGRKQLDYTFRLDVRNSLLDLGERGAASMLHSLWPTLLRQSQGGAQDDVAPKPVVNYGRQSTSRWPCDRIVRSRQNSAVSAH